MEINQIPLCHFITGLERAGIDPSEIVPQSSMADRSGACGVMVERGVPGNGTIGIPIVTYDSGRAILLGMRKIQESGRVIDIIHDPHRAPLRHRWIRTELAHATILGAFGAEEFSGGAAVVLPETHRLGLGIMAYWMSAEMDSMLFQLDFLRDVNGRLEELLPLLSMRQSSRQYLSRDVSAIEERYQGLELLLAQTREQLDSVEEETLALAP